MKKILVLAGLVLALMATPAIAKEGLYLGGSIFYNSISGHSLDAYDNSYVNTLDDGLGVSLRGGVGFNRYLAVEASYLISSFDAGALGNQDFRAAVLDLKLNFPLTGTEIAPYVKAGVGQYKLGSNYYKGNGVNFGIGIDYYIMPELSMDFGFAWHSVTFDKGNFHWVYDLDADIKILEVGLSYHFF